MYFHKLFGVFSLQIVTYSQSQFAMRSNLIGNRSGEIPCEKVHGIPSAIFEQSSFDGRVSIQRQDFVPCRESRKNLPEIFPRRFIFGIRVEVMLVEEILVQAITKTLSRSDRFISELTPFGLQVIPNIARIIRTPRGLIKLGARSLLPQ